MMGNATVKIKPGKGNSVLSLEEIHWARSSDDTAMEWSLKVRGRVHQAHGRGNGGGGEQQVQSRALSIPDGLRTTEEEACVCGAQRARRGVEEDESKWSSEPDRVGPSPDLGRDGSSHVL